MKILVFDTCFNKSYISLCIDDEVIQSKIIESDKNNYHSAYLIPEIKNILVKNNLFVKDLDALGVNIGPGSFTGIRAGITIARVLSQQFNIKLIGINSLKILSNLNKENTHTSVILDARKNKVYFGEYNDGIEITSPCLKDKDEIISLIEKDSTIISDSSIGALFAQNGIDYINHELSNENYGLYLMTIVKEKLKDKENAYNWAEVKPLYIQKPSITKSKEKTNVF